MDYREIDFEEETNIFIKHMENGLAKNNLDLKMIPTYIDLNREIKFVEPIIVIDAGGTNFRRALVSFKEDEVIIEEFQTFSMPGSKGEITKTEFFDTIVKYIEPLLNKSTEIGFCFSYPVEILPNADGKVLSLSKEVKVKDIENVKLGETLLEHIKKYGYKENKKVVILNDTTAVLLSGMSISSKTRYHSYIGLILGTGTNTCYQEENNNILKDQLILKKKGKTIINIESGGYNGVNRGIIDKILDNKSNNPNEQQFEKMISGAYQGILIFESIKKAGEDGYISKEFYQGIKNILNISSKDVSDFHNSPYSKDNVISELLDMYGTEEDRIKMFYLIDFLIERAAKLLVINIKAIIKHTNAGRNPCQPVCISVDGSAFYGSQLFMSKFDYYVKKYINNEGYYVKRIKVEDGILIGAAKSVLISKDNR
nr:hypothetical protein [Alkalibaculum sporogenes]